MLGILSPNLWIVSGMKQQKSEADLSIVIVSYNTKELLRARLKTLQGAIIVVDNASGDGSYEMVKKEFPNVDLIKNQQNVGFARANNQGIQRTKSKYVLLLNTDCEATRQAITETLKFFETHPEVGGISCKLVLPDGSIDPACHRGFPTPWASLTYFIGLEKLFRSSILFGQYHQGYKPMGEIHDVDCISGAFFLVRREVIEQVGLLDEAFFMYGEDIDWCFRIRKAGYKIQFYPHVSIVHKKHQSGLAHADSQLRFNTQKHFYDAMKLFYNKHYRYRYNPIVSAFVLMGIKLRSLL